MTGQFGDQRLFSMKVKAIWLIARLRADARSRTTVPL
jgi:hypothetical protein